MSNKSNFLNLVTSKDENARTKLEDEIKNREWRRESKKIAFKILASLKEKGWTQKDLAEKMNVSPQQVSKLVSGKQNLTLSTIVKLENTLDLKLLNKDTKTHHSPKSTKSAVYWFAIESEKIKVINENEDSKVGNLDATPLTIIINSDEFNKELREMKYNLNQKSDIYNYSS